MYYPFMPVRTIVNPKLHIKEIAIYLYTINVMDIYFQSALYMEMAL
jgi:hypothetical protein